MVGWVHQEEAVDLGPDPRFTLAEYCQECGERMDTGCFRAMDVGGNILILRDQNNFQRDTALDTWKQR